MSSSGNVGVFSWLSGCDEKDLRVQEQSGWVASGWYHLLFNHGKAMRPCSLWVVVDSACHPFLLPEKMFRDLPRCSNQTQTKAWHEKTGMKSFEEAFSSEPSDLWTSFELCSSRPDFCPEGKLKLGICAMHHLLAVSLSWLDIFQILASWLLPFDGWYGWVFSDSLVQLTFQEKWKCFRQILQHLTDLQEPARHLETPLVWL